MVNGPPRSLVKANGDFGSCPRCNRRNARKLVARDGLGSRGAALDATDMQGSGGATCAPRSLGNFAPVSAETGLTRRAGSRSRTSG